MDANLPVSRPVLLFDGQCTLCDRSVQFILDREADSRLAFASLQSTVGRRLLDRAQGEVPDSLVLVDDEGVHTRSEAALRVAGYLHRPWKWLRLARWVPMPVRDRAYDVVARNRYRWFGTRDECRIPTPDLRARFLDADETDPTASP